MTDTVEIRTCPRFIRVPQEPARTERYHPGTTDAATTATTIQPARDSPMTFATSEDVTLPESVDLRRKQPRVPFYMGVPKRRKR